MPGAFSNWDLTENEFERARKAAQKLGLVDLTSANPALAGFEFPQQILQDAAVKAIRERRYKPDPAGLISAREAIAEYYLQRTGREIPPENLVITASTSEAYRLLFSLLTDPGDTVFLPEVTYPLFELFAGDCRLRTRSYRLDSIAESVDAEARAIVIVSPHNPCGCVVRDLRPVAARAPIPIVVDEVFAEFVDEPVLPPLLSGHDLDTPVFTLNGVSKMFALPDLKVGWIVMNEAARREFGERLLFLNDLYLSASYIGQAMLPDIFARGIEFCAEYTKSVRRNMAEAVQAAGGRVRVVMPEGGATLICEVEGVGSDEEVALKLLERGVSVYPGYYFGLEERTSVVISGIAKKEELLRGLEAIGSL